MSAREREKELPGECGELTGRARKPLLSDGAGPLSIQFETAMREVGPMTRPPQASEQLLQEASLEGFLESPSGSPQARHEDADVLLPGANQSLDNESPVRSDSASSSAAAHLDALVNQMGRPKSADRDASKQARAQPPAEGGLNVVGAEFGSPIQDSDELTPIVPLDAGPPAAGPPPGRPGSAARRRGVEVVAQPQAPQLLAPPLELSSRPAAVRADEALEEQPLLQPMPQVRETLPAVEIEAAAGHEVTQANAAAGDGEGQGAGDVVKVEQVEQSTGAAPTAGVYSRPPVGLPESPGPERAASDHSSTAVGDGERRQKADTGAGVVEGLPSGSRPALRRTITTTSPAGLDGSSGVGEGGGDGVGEGGGDGGGGDVGEMAGTHGGEGIGRESARAEAQLPVSPTPHSHSDQLGETEAAAAERMLQHDDADADAASKAHMTMQEALKIAFSTADANGKR